MREWEKPGDIGLTDAALVSIIQLARGWSDAELADRAGLDMAEFDALRHDVEEIRSALADLIYLPSTVARLRLPGFATTVVSSERVADALALTIVGLYRTLSDWYLRAGEGRVETIKAVIDAERAVRSISGVIVFDSGKRIRWRQGTSAPGYEGVAGLFSQLLGDERFTALAVMSSELYMTRSGDPLPPRIAAFIESELMCGEIGGAIFGLAVHGIAVRPEITDRLRLVFDELVGAYVTGLSGSRAQRPGEFRRKVLRHSNVLRGGIWIARRHSGCVCGFSPATFTSLDWS